MFAFVGKRNINVFKVIAFFRVNRFLDSKLFKRNIALENDGPLEVTV